MEKLKPLLLIEDVTLRINELKKLQETLGTSIKNGPKGSLIVSSRKGGAEYYQQKEGKCTYISVKNQELIKSLAQMDYQRKTIQICKNEIKVLTKLIRKYEAKGSRGINTSNVYFTQNKHRQSLTSPVTYSNKMYIENWEQKEYQPKKLYKDQVTYQTQKGEIVRSKSELIIANILKENNIPYHYEYPFETSKGIFHPDFFCLNVRTRQEFYWEHFGMLDDTDYLKTALQKLNILSENNLIPGKNLITTFETSDTPISASYVQKLINEFLM